MKELIFGNDSHRMDWLRKDFAYGKVDCPRELHCRVETRQEGDLAFTRVVISNPGSKPYFSHRKSISIAFPLVDKYEDSRSCMERRCHTHIFCGGAVSYICALRMGGEAPHLGMVLTRGSLAGYSIQRNILSQSNDRGCFLLHPSPMELGAGESTILEWTIFSHTGWEDFFRKLSQYNPRFIRVSADRYVLFPGEGNTLHICPSFAAGQVTVNGRKLPERDGKYDLEYTASGTGEQVFEISADGVTTWCRTYVQDNPRRLARRRCMFLAQNQQYHGRVKELEGAYLAYDNEEGLLVYRPENDYNGGRERIGMGILITRYLAGRDREENPLLWDSLAQYRDYVLRELVDAKTGKVFNDMGQDGSFQRLYNAPWAATFFTEQYFLRREREDLLCACRILMQFYQEGGLIFIP